MSVLNQVLQELQARRAGEVATDPAVRATAARPPRRRLGLWLLAGTAAAAGLAFGDWPTLLSANAAYQPQPVAMVEVSAPPPAASAVEVAVAAPPKAVARAEVRRKSVEAKPRAVAKAAPATESAAPSAPKPAAVPAEALALAPPVAAAARNETAAPGRVDKQMTAPSSAVRAQALHRQGLELAAGGQGHAAVLKLQEALALEPKLRAARQQAVALLFEQQRIAEAEALAREGLAQAPDDAALSYLLARGLAASGDNAAALALLAQSPRLNADAHGLRAGLYAQQGDFKRALPDYEMAVRLQPGNSLWWLGLGVALEADGQRAQARQVYARAQGLGVESHDLNVFLDQKLAALK